MYRTVAIEIRVHITDKDEARLREIAASLAKTPEEMATSLLRGALFDELMEQRFGHIRDRFEASGMTDDELSEFLEQEKHAMRAEQRARKAS